MFDKCKSEGGKYIYTEIDLGYPSTEIIINPVDNIDEKIKYLCKTYNDDLEHPHAPVKIVSFGWCYNLSQLEYVRINGGSVN